MAPLIRLVPGSLPILISLLGVLVLGACARTPREPAPPLASPFAALPLNHLQVIGTHNSYKVAPEPALLALIAATRRDQAEAIDYTHLRVTDQLNLGVRNLELDIAWDPDGGRYASPLGNRLLALAGTRPVPINACGSLDTPGFKVIHDPDFDFRSHHHDLESYLREMRAWSRRNPSHEPVIVTMNCKSGKSRFPGGTDCAEFTREAFAALDATIRTHLGDEHLVTPDLVRGSDATLEGAILSRGWPSVGTLRGRYLFVLDEGRAVRERYVEGHPSCRGRVFFVTAPPGEPEAAVLIINDPVREQARIRDLVTRGYLVRTRADADTREPRSGDLSRFEAAKASGAQVITTDYPIPDRKINPDFVVRFDDAGFIRVNPITAQPAVGTPAPAGSTRR